MTKRKSGRRTSARGSGAAKSIDEYLVHVAEPARRTLNKMRAAIRSAVPPEATEGISYGVPVFKYNGPLVWFGAFSSHCSWLPTAAVVDAFKMDLAGFSTSKGTIQFPINKPLPTALIKKIVKERVGQKQGKKPRPPRGD